MSISFSSAIIVNNLEGGSTLQSQRWYHSAFCGESSDSIDVYAVVTFRAAQCGPAQRIESLLR
jgi:hypothetical protein